MIWQIKTIGNGTHFRSSIPGFSMFTSPTVAWKIILTFASFHLFSWRKHPKSFHLLVKPVNLFQLLISESFVDFFAHGVRCLVKLLLESHDDQVQTLDTVGQGVGGLNGLNSFFLVKMKTVLAFHCSLQAKVSMVCSGMPKLPSCRCSQLLLSCQLFWIQYNQRLSPTFPNSPYMIRLPFLISNNDNWQFDIFGQASLLREIISQRHLFVVFSFNLRGFSLCSHSLWQINVKDIVSCSWKGIKKQRKFDFKT